MVVADAWLSDNFAAFPLDEKAVQAVHVAPAVALGSDIVCSLGVYPAELQAIARALAMTPLSFHLTIHTDSQAAIAAIGSYSLQLNERKRLRMAARPLLQLISNLLTRRTQAGGQLQLRHVEAHTKKMDLPSVGNRIADFQANVARLDKSRRHPRELDELPLHRCEQYLFLQRQAGLEIIDDIRRSALCDLRAKALSRWTKNLEQGLLACEGIVELGRAALCAGSPDDQIALIHIATNSIHFTRAPEDPAAPDDTPLRQIQCEHCRKVPSLSSILPAATSSKPK